MLLKLYFTVTEPTEKIESSARNWVTKQYISTDPKLSEHQTSHKPVMSRSKNI